MGKIYNIKRIWSRPFFVNLKKHYCPVCGEELQKIKVSKIVNSKSEEAKDYDFSSPGGRWVYVWGCEICMDRTPLLQM